MTARAQKQAIARMQRAAAQAKARERVQAQEALISRLTSFHKQRVSIRNWERVPSIPAPQPRGVREAEAEANLQRYQPSWWDSLFGKAARRRQELLLHLHNARHADAREHQHRWGQWSELQRIAPLVLSGDIESFASVIRAEQPWHELMAATANKLEFKLREPWYLECNLGISSLAVVPKKDLTLTKTGKLSERSMAKGKRMLLQQDYVCSAALYVALKGFATLPIHAVFVHVHCGAVDTSTGHNRQDTIVSAAFDRPSLLALNRARTDASDALQRFPHHMKFKKTKGFEPVERMPIIDMMSG